MITNILKDVIDDYRSNNRVIIEEKEKGHEGQVDNLTEITNKTHEMMDRAPLIDEQGWLDSIIESVLHLSNSGISLQLISASVLLPIIAEYSLRNNCDIPEGAKTMAEIEKEFISKYPKGAKTMAEIRGEFISKYPKINQLPSPEEISNGFAQSGLSGGSKQQLLLTNIGKLAMRNLKAKKIVVNCPKTWNRYSPTGFQRYQGFNQTIPNGDRNLKQLQTLESFAFNIDTSLQVKIQTNEQLASMQNRNGLHLSSPAQKIVREAIVEDRGFALMSDIISIQTPMVPANFKSARHQQKLLYQNFLLDLAGNEYSNQNEKIILVKKFGDFVDRNLDGLNRLALSGNSDKLTHHLRNLEPLESKVTDSLRRNYQEIPELDDQIADVLANWPETDSSSTEWGWTSLITPVGKAYQTLKTLPEGHRLHQGYFMKELQSEELIIDYSHALVSTDSEEQKLMRLNNFINLYRNSTPKVLGEAVLTVRKVHTQLLDSDNIVLPKGSNDTIEKANKLLLRAQIANSIKYGTKNN